MTNTNESAARCQPILGTDRFYTAAHARLPGLYDDLDLEMCQPINLPRFAVDGRSNAQRHHFNEAWWAGYGLWNSLVLAAAATKHLAPSTLAR